VERKATEAIATVKDVATENVNGEFEIVMSTDSVDRDGEVIVKGAFNPLPDSIPVHAFHDFNDPIGRAVPSYNEKGQLVGRGFFASTARAQEVRQLVADGVIGHTSVGFMAADRKAEGDGPTQIQSAELLEVSFVSVTSNRDARVLAAKAFYDEKVGSRNNMKDAERLQLAHDLMVENGAVCDSSKHPSVTMNVTVTAPTDTTAPETPAAEAGKSPASVVTQARLAAARALLDI
jgi:HK97 family phage prohead protease